VILALATALAPACTTKQKVVETPAPAPAPDPTHFVIRGVRIAGGPAAPTDVEIRAGRFIAVGKVGKAPRVVDGTGYWIVPGFIDSHVHLALEPASSTLASWGVVAAVDMAAPEKFLESTDPVLRRIASGPMITSEEGYPTQSWGRDGFGIECPVPMCARAAVAKLKLKGARLIKLAVGERGLDEASLRAAADQAQRMRLWVAAHALTDGDAATAWRVGATILAHTPITKLSPSTVELWGRGTVITTLAAFGADRQAADNLRALRKAGAQVLYGTDFGNTKVSGISGKEIALMQAAGMSGKEILAAGTSTPAHFWGWTELGAIADGKVASFLLVDRDPAVDPLVLAKPKHVYFEGERQR
jgi:imidazolonepropionase-like amidohydrolase